jgi:coenzyme F420-0:L-glutamate ligase/coenzyme F420-1:gamma-L-glutamate ligase
MTAGGSRDPQPPTPVTVTPLLGFPEVREGDDLAGIVWNGLQDNHIQLIDGDVLVISSKVVSKALGLRAPATRQAEVVLSHSVRVVAERMTAFGVTRIVESAAGPVMTAAGVDASNTADAAFVLLLPQDPDAVAAQIRGRLQSAPARGSGRPAQIGIILSDTAGRPWREGQTDFALGSCGLEVVEDLRGSVDASGRALLVTERCIADEIASAADLVKGKTAGVPVAHVRGLGQHVHHGDTASGARDIVRTGPRDWFSYGTFEAIRAALGVEPGSPSAIEIGIPSITPEDVATRANRAIRTALLSCHDTSGHLEGDAIRVEAPDDFELGVAATRVEVALRGEGLTPNRTIRPAQSLTPDADLTPQPAVLIVFQ